MKTKRVYKGVWAGCSNLKERIKEKEANMVSPEELSKMLDEWQLTTATHKPKRPRIQRIRQPKQVVVRVFGKEFVMPIDEYQQRGKGLTIVMEIY